MKSSEAILVAYEEVLIKKLYEQSLLWNERSKILREIKSSLPTIRTIMEKLEMTNALTVIEAFVENPEIGEELLEVFPSSPIKWLGEIVERLKREEDAYIPEPVLFLKAYQLVEEILDPYELYFFQTLLTRIMMSISLLCPKDGKTYKTTMMSLLTTGITDVEHFRRAFAPTLQDYLKRRK